MRKLNLFLMIMCALLSFSAVDVCAKNTGSINALVDLKIMPMPNNRARFEFKFADIVKKVPTSFVTKKPSRLVLDFIDTDNKLAAADKKIDISSVTQYRVVSVGDRLRIIFYLSDAITYSGTVTGSVYTLTVSGKGDELIPRTKKLNVASRTPRARYLIKNVDFRGTKKQGGRVIVDVSETGVPVDVKQSGQDVEATFTSTKIPFDLARRYDVADFHSPAQFFEVFQRGSNTIVKLINKGDYGYFVYQINKQFILDVFPLTPEEIKQAKLKKKVFAGKRISLNFQDIQIRAVLQLLAEFTGVNVVVSDKVNGNITLRLNDIPWDQALDIILTTQGLEKRQTGNVILVDTNAEFAARESQALQEMESAKKLAPIRSELLQINYAKAADIATMLKDKNSSLLSERGKLSVDARTNTIWLQDTGARIQEVQELVQKLDIPVRQVLIEARIVNVSKDCAEDIGIQWGVSKPTHLSGTLEGANQLAGNTPPADVPVTQRLNLDLAALPVDASPASVGIALAKLGSGVLLDLELSALESEGRAEIIASPRLMTTNQQAALIESGEDIPYQEATSSGATAVAFKKAVLSLKVTPQITPDAKLLLDLQINQDADSGQRVQGVPIISTKAIETNVLVNNGQTIVLGGIYQQNKNNNVTRIPFLGSMPFVGNLFRRTQVSVKNEELLIFITPKIITNNLSITSIDGGRQHPPQGGELDKFGKPVRHSF